MAVRINGVKVFSATMALDRARLGETITEWIVRHPNLSIVDVVQTQSSDESFHCVAITVFFHETAQTRERHQDRVAIPSPRRLGRRIVRHND